jgi:very-short-patch-repair endonuclease
LVRYNGKRRRIDLCYVEEMLALEALGFEFRRSRARFDDEALRGNQLQLLGFRVLEFTSAFTDREIAEQVAHALGVDLPAGRDRPRTFDAWLAR